MKLFGLLILLPLACVAFAAEEVPALPTDTPQPEVVAYAKSHGIPLGPIEAPHDSAGANIGDAVTLLITLREKSASRQWLAQFRVVALTEKERAEEKPKTTRTKSGGRTFEFNGTRSLALEILTAGPFVPGTNAPPEEKRGRSLVSPDFLALGFDQLCELMSLAEKSEPDPDSPAAEKRARATAGYGPAMNGFFGAVQSTPGLRGIMWKVIELPSLWSIITHRGFELGFTTNRGGEVQPDAWSLPGQKIYWMNLDIQMNQQPMLNCIYFVTAARPPLLPVAGVVGITAYPPSNTNKRADLRVLAATRAATPPQASSAGAADSR